MGVPVGSAYRSSQSQCWLSSRFWPSRRLCGNRQPVHPKEICDCRGAKVIAVVLYAFSRSSCVGMRRFWPLWVTLLTRWLTVFRISCVRPGICFVACVQALAMLTLLPDGRSRRRRSPARRKPLHPRRRRHLFSLIRRSSLCRREGDRARTVQVHVYGDLGRRGIRRH